MLLTPRAQDVLKPEHIAKQSEETFNNALMSFSLCHGMSSLCYLYP